MVTCERCWLLPDLSILWLKSVASIFVPRQLFSLKLFFHFIQRTLLFHCGLDQEQFRFRLLGFLLWFWAQLSFQSLQLQLKLLILLLLQLVLLVKLIVGILVLLGPQRRTLLQGFEPCILPFKSFDHRFQPVLVFFQLSFDLLPVFFLKVDPLL